MLSSPRMKVYPNALIQAALSPNLEACCDAEKSNAQPCYCGRSRYSISCRAHCTRQAGFMNQPYVSLCDTHSGIYVIFHRPQHDPKAGRISFA